MRYLPTLLLTLALGVGCGYFQYWMFLRLDRKRWLLLLQPGLFAVIAVCFQAWTMTIDKLENVPERFAAAPFAVLLLCTLVGWGAGIYRKKKM